MCGIFGIVLKENISIKKDFLNKSTKELFKLSESRGKEASGIALKYIDGLKVFKKPFSASQLIKDNEFKSLFLNKPLALIGHARLVTDGNLEDNRNNQPVVKQGIVGVHNGIIVNNKDIWQKFSNLAREYEVDTEVILSLFNMFLKQGSSLEEATKETFFLLEGSASIALFFKEYNYLVLATNTGSLYYSFNQSNSVFVFASERYILETFFKKRIAKKVFSGSQINQIKANKGLLVKLNDLSKQNIELSRQRDNQEKTIEPRKIINNFDILPWQDRIDNLKRCTRCILPETMPFIEFDEKGVCNYCNNYQKIKIKGAEALKQFIAPYKNKNGRPDCIVTLSGGRDSCYSLHYMKNVLGMNPIAYSYDWGMVTDLARRNQARMCGKLGVEQIIVSADIKRKRENIRKNVLAWLRKPELGTVPLFMAGDKQYFYYANQLRKKTGIKIVVLAVNYLEKTDFKHGFCNIKPVQSLYSLPIAGQFQIAFYYLKQFAKNPAYLNKSLADSFVAFCSYYVIGHNYLFLFHYIKWDQDEVVGTLINKYDWELAPDTKDSWRIGDGTAPFYNYIYYTVAGFTENDTFRSNQIREGIIKREEALKLAKESNQPRMDSIKEYCQTIGIDFKDTINKIHSISKLYE